MYKIFTLNVVKLVLKENSQADMSSYKKNQLYATSCGYLQILIILVVLTKSLTDYGGLLAL